jgi:YesN/AraC family two-component response regulator
MRKNILIVDDNKHFLNGFQALLNLYFSDRIGKVYRVTNGYDAIDLVKEEKIHLVFMDYEMPGISGAVATKIISNDNRFVRIIALSFHSEFINIKEMIEAGARDYIIKDKINKETLRKYLESSQQ